jgi:hypothetical protein
MESGALGVMSYTAGAQWFRERSILALGGETIVSKPLGGMIWLDGQRCSGCRFVQLHY